MPSTRPVAKASSASLMVVHEALTPRWGMSRSSAMNRTRTARSVSTVSGVGVGEVGRDGGVLVTHEVEQGQPSRFGVGGPDEHHRATRHDLRDSFGEGAATDAVEDRVEQALGRCGVVDDRGSDAGEQRLAGVGTAGHRDHLGAAEGGELGLENGPRRRRHR